jgi:uncharacterized membrane protein YhaH (DUF805 family)
MTSNIIFGIKALNYKSFYQTGMQIISFLALLDVLLCFLVFRLLDVKKPEIPMYLVIVGLYGFAFLMFSVHYYIFGYTSSTVIYFNDKKISSTRLMHYGNRRVTKVFYANDIRRIAFNTSKNQIEIDFKTKNGRDDLTITSSQFDFQATESLTLAKEIAMAFDHSEPIVEYAESPS